MGARASRSTQPNTAPSPPPYETSKNIVDAVLEKYVRCATYNTTNGYLNQNFQKELFYLLRCKTGRDPDPSTVLLLCNLYSEQIKQHGGIVDFYTERDFFFKK